MSRTKGHSPNTRMGVDEKTWLKIHRAGFDSGTRAARDAWQFVHPEDSDELIQNSIRMVVRMAIQAQQPSRPWGTRV